MEGGRNGESDHTAGAPGWDLTVCVCRAGGGEEKKKKKKKKKEEEEERTEKGG